MFGWKTINIPRQMYEFPNIAQACLEITTTQVTQDKRSLKLIE